MKCGYSWAQIGSRTTMTLGSDRSKLHAHPFPTGNSKLSLNRVKLASLSEAHFQKIMYAHSETRDFVGLSCTLPSISLAFPSEFCFSGLTSLLLLLT